MSGIPSFLTPGRVNKINLLCLLLAVCWILIFPLKKEIWYDETVSVLISKGISHATPYEFANTAKVTNVTLNQMNNAGNVFHATVVDNGNSYLYNMCLHYFTAAFGNTMNVYVLFSKLCAAAALLAFFFLCGLFFEGSLFTALALVLFASDKIFWGMGHEIRAYEMGMFFVIMAAAYCYKYLYKQEKPVYLLLTALFAVGAVLSHYLSVYAVLVLVGYLIVNKKAALFAPKNLLYLLIPVLLIGIYFYCAFSGFRQMSSQNMAIKERTAHEGFSIVKAMLLSMKFTALNFKMVFPAFKDAKAIVAISFLMVAGIYTAALKMSATKEDKRNLNLLFLLGISSTLFLLMLSVKAQHYTALYSRYYIFAIPFSALFITYAVKVFFTHPGFNKAMASGITAIILLPCVVVYLLGIVKNKPELKYNHIAIARSIVNDKITQIEVPDWNEAFLVSGFMPTDYPIEYVLNKTSNDFVLHRAAGTERIPLLRLDN